MSHGDPEDQPRPPHRARFRPRWLTIFKLLLFLARLIWEVMQDS